MDQATLRFLLGVLAVGLVAVLGVFVATRALERRTRATLAAPPERALPGLPADAPAPAYVAAEAVPARRAGVDDPERAREAQALVDGREPALPHGWADRRLATAGELCVLRDADVAALPEGAGSMRELLTVLSRAEGHALLVLARSLPDDVVATLAANATSGLLEVCVVVTGDDGTLADVAERLDAPLLHRADLQSGWVPRLGHVDTWVSGPDASWIVA